MSASISIIIPTLNAESLIEPLIISLLQQTLDFEEILVIDSSSDDRTIDIANQFENIVRTREIDRSSFNHGLTRHLAFMEAKGDYVCFFTQDAIPTDCECLCNLLEPMIDPTIGAVTGRQIPKPEASRYEQLVREFNYGRHSSVRSLEDIGKYGMKTFFASDVCSVYRRVAYFDCGGFPKTNSGEDILMASRLLHKGWRVAYAANATVYHSHNETFISQFRRNKATGEFLEFFADDFYGVNEIDSGLQLVSSVSRKLIDERDFLNLIRFGFDCFARLSGDRVGRLNARRLISKLDCA